MKNDFNFWLIFGLSPNLGLSERLIQKVKRRNDRLCIKVSVQSVIQVELQAGAVMFLLALRCLSV